MPVVSDYTALLSGSYWTGIEVTGRPVIVTYSFPTTIPFYDTSIGGFTAATVASVQPFTAQEQVQARQALGEWAAASGLVFLEVAPGQGDINFQNADFSTSSYSGAGGIGFYPFGNWDYFSHPYFSDDLDAAGEIFMNSQYLTNGEVNYGTLLHEIGHAIGLKHPTQDDVYSADGIHHDQVLASDDPGQTVMATVGDGTPGNDVHLKLLDQQAAAAIYGAAGTGGVYTASASGTNAIASWSFDAATQTVIQTGSGTDDAIRGTSITDVIYGLGGNDKLFGLAGNDTLYGGDGNDSLYSGSGPGTDTLVGGADSDSYYVSNVNAKIVEDPTAGYDWVYATVNVTLSANVEALSLYGKGLTGTGNDDANQIYGDGTYATTIHAGGGADYIVGGAGNDILDGGTGADTIYGLAGNDTYYVDDAGDVVNEATGGGTDTVYASVDYTLGAGQEIEALRANAGTTGLKLTGNALANALYSGAGADVLAGAAGNDTYYVNGASDQVIEAIGGGSDAIYASVDYTLGAGQEIEYLVANAGTKALTLTGNALANTLISGAGLDVLAGGAGNDTYNVNAAGDQVIEQAGGGTDTVFASVDYILGAGQEIEQLFANAGSTGLTLTGNELANRLVGGAGADHLYGGGGKDVLEGRGGADILEGGAGDDLYYLDSGSDQVIEAAGGGTDNVYTSASFALAAGQEIEYLRANAGSTGLTLTGNERGDNLISGAGLDTLIGGAGNDTYNVNNAGDQVIEQVGGGTDTVFASVSYTLAAGQEIEFLRANAGSTGLTLTGNEFANTLYSGNGLDTLVGGGGNDTYWVNNGNDVVKEALGGGTDNVYASTSFTLGAGQEVEYLRANAGSTGLTLTGNELANTLISGAGLDTLIGGAGNDTYNVNNAGDQVTEQVGGGTDTVYASTSYTLGANQEIEFLRANAGSTGLTLTGNSLANTVVGGTGNDTIAGGGGPDTLRGGTGADSFVFKALSDSVVGSGRATIADFTVGADHIDLSAIQAVSGASTDQAFSFIGTGAFTQHAGELHQTTAGGTTLVEGDVDGNGTADFQIALTGNLTLHAGDFVL